MVDYFMQLRPGTGAIEAIGTGKFDGVFASVKLAEEVSAPALLRSIDNRFQAAVNASRRA